MDFIGCAFNQITNMVAKAHYRWGAPAPIVIRGPSGGNVHGDVRLVKSELNVRNALRA